MRAMLVLAMASPLLAAAPLPLPLGRLRRLAGDGMCAPEYHGSMKGIEHSEFNFRSAAVIAAPAHRAVAAAWVVRNYAYAQVRIYHPPKRVTA
jgi:hypothetical protein